MTSIFQDVMARNKISPGLVPAENAFNFSRRKKIEVSSERYFVIKGFATFSCPKHRVWPSAHAWCFIDLKTQSLRHRYKQRCKKCNYSAKPIFAEEAFENMMQKAVNKFLRRRGLKKRIKRLKNMRRTTHKIPHDTIRCERCKDKRSNCSKI